MGRWRQSPLQEGKETQSQQAQLQAEARDPGCPLGLGVVTSCSGGN